DYQRRRCIQKRLRDWETRRLDSLPVSQSLSLLVSQSLKMNPITQTNLYREIYEQPAVLRRLLAEQQTAVNQLAQTIREQEISHVVIAARGTSDNAGRYAQYLFGAMNGLPVALSTPSLFTIYKRPP